MYRETEKFAENCCALLDTCLSGSPIVQNGKIIGAVTHVFVQDASKGYGIFIENMLEHNKEISRYYKALRAVVVSALFNILVQDNRQ